MANRLLAITRNTIPYVKELRNECGSVTASILMQQLEYWFDKHPKGFYKFLSPNKNKLCKTGDTWSEELNFSEDEFRTAFSKIGISYKSKNLFELSNDSFQDKFYCSYFNKLEGTTHYFRNDEAVDSFLNSIVTPVIIEEIKIKVSTPRKQALSVYGKQTKATYVNEQSQLTEIDKGNILTVYTDTTSNTTTESEKENLQFSTLALNPDEIIDNVPPKLQLVEAEKEIKKEKSSEKKESKISLINVENENVLKFDNPIILFQNWETWLRYKQSIKKPFKTAESESIGVKHLYNISGGKVSTAIEIIETSIGNGYQGLFELRQNFNKLKEQEIKVNLSDRTRYNVADARDF